MKRILFLVFFFPFITRAETIIWTGQNDFIDIGDKVEVLEDTKGEFTFDQVSSNEFQQKFTASTSTNLVLGYTESVFWIKFTFQNQKDQNLVLEISQAGLPVCDYFCRTDSGKVVTYNAGSNTYLKDKIIKNSFQVFPLQSGQHDYYIRLTTNSGPIPFRIYNIDTYEVKSQSQRMVYGIYLGLMIFVFLSNLFFFFSLRNFLYIANAFNVIIFISYSMVVVDGFITNFLQRVDMLFWYTTIPPLGVTIQLIYSVWFLELKKYRPKIFQYSLGIIALFVVWFLLKFFLPFSIVQPINTLQALLSFFIIGFISVQVGRSGNKFGYYFAITYFIYFLLVLAEATYINTGKPTYILGFSYSGHATVVEALALSFLLTKKFEWEKEEVERTKSEAQRLLVEKTVENERIVRDQNVILEQMVEERTFELKEAVKKSEELLLNILPKSTADELKSFGKAKARTYGMVTVMFTDFKDFTTVSENISPELLVGELDYCFSAFDKIIQNYKIEKIKTVGDAYICVGGMPELTYSHATDVVKAGIEFRNFILDRKREKEKKGEIAFDIRIGIHTGPVVAGIVGVNKFAYDIWGDAVNIAARMESTGEAGKVNISGSTYKLVKDYFDSTYRGKIHAKNKGEIDMYFVDATI